MTPIYAESNWIVLVIIWLTVLLLRTRKERKEKARKRMKEALRRVDERQRLEDRSSLGNLPAQEKVEIRQRELEQEISERFARMEQEAGVSDGTNFDYVPEIDIEEEHQMKSHFHENRGLRFDTFSVGPESDYEREIYDRPETPKRRRPGLKPKNLREYVVIHELIGAPLAKRRRYGRDL